MCDHPKCASIATRAPPPRRGMWLEGLVGINAVRKYDQTCANCSMCVVIDFEWRRLNWDCFECIHAQNPHTHTQTACMHLLTDRSYITRTFTLTNSTIYGPIDRRQSAIKYQTRIDPDRRVDRSSVTCYFCALIVDNFGALRLWCLLREHSDKYLGAFLCTCECRAFIDAINIGQNRMCRQHDLNTIAMCAVRCAKKIPIAFYVAIYDRIRLLALSYGVADVPAIGNQ